MLYFRYNQDLRRLFLLFSSIPALPVSSLSAPLPLSLSPSLFLSPSIPLPPFSSSEYDIHTLSKHIFPLPFFPLLSLSLFLSPLFLMYFIHLTFNRHSINVMISKYINKIKKRTKGSKRRRRREEEKKRRREEEE